MSQHTDTITGTDARQTTTQDTRKNEVVEAIRERNRSAEREFLMSFDEQTLSSYLHRLTHLSNRRGRDSAWTRDHSTRAVVTRTPH